MARVPAPTPDLPEPKQRPARAARTFTKRWPYNVIIHTPTPDQTAGMIRIEYYPLDTTDDTLDTTDLRVVSTDKLFQFLEELPALRTAWTNLVNLLPQLEAAIEADAARQRNPTPPVPPGR